MRSETERESELVCVTCVCVTVSLCVHVCACVCLYLCMICNARAELRRENCFLPFFFKNSFLRKYFFEKKLCRHRTSMLKNGATMKMKLFSSSFFLKQFFEKKYVFVKKLCRRRTSMPKNGETKKMKLLMNVLGDWRVLLVSCRYSYYH